MEHLYRSPLGITISCRLLYYQYEFKMNPSFKLGLYALKRSKCELVFVPFGKNKSHIYISN